MAGTTEQMAETSPGNSIKRGRRIFRALCLAAILLISVEVGVFRSGLYFRIVEPVSYCGQVLSVLRGGLSFHREAGEAARVVVVGDSRMAEGFSAKICDQAGPSGLRWYNASVSGSTPRVWSYLLETLLDKGVEIDLVVVPLQSLAGRATEFGIADRTLDAQFMPPLLSFWEAGEFAFSFAGTEQRKKMLLPALLFSFALRNDVIHFLSNPDKRLDAVERNQESYRDHYNYNGRNADLKDRVWVENGNPVFSPAVSDEEIRQFKESLVPYTSQVRAEEISYQRRWIKKMEETCRAEGMRLMIVRAPRGPLGDLYPSENQVDPRERLDLAPETILVQADFFGELEKPEYFWDHLHMNARGREAFSKLLLELVAEIQSERPLNLSVGRGSKGGKSEEEVTLGGDEPFFPGSLPEQRPKKVQDMSPAEGGKCFYPESTRGGSG